MRRHAIVVSVLGRANTFVYVLFPILSWSLHESRRLDGGIGDEGCAYRLQRTRKDQKGSPRASFASSVPSAVIMCVNLYLPTCRCGHVFVRGALRVEGAMVVLV